MSDLFENEIFKEIPDYPCTYISNKGRVKRNDVILKITKNKNRLTFFLAQNKNGKLDKLCIELEMRKLFPELKFEITSQGLKAKKIVAPEIEKEIKQKYNKGITVENLAEMYGITLEYANQIIKQIPNKKLFIFLD